MKRQFDLNKDADKNSQAIKVFVENKNPEILQSKADKITTRKDVQAAARQIAHHLGTAYYDPTSWWSWSNPRSWGENEDEVYHELYVQQKNFAYLEKLYYHCYTANLDLRADLLRLMPESTLEDIRKTLKINV